VTESNWDVVRRPDGVLLVRIRSGAYRGVELPDAVFTFRAGDPQYELWESRFREQQGSRPGPRTNGTARP
jgi:hypothetical protein